MEQNPIWAFVFGLGVPFALGFIGLTTTWAYLVLRLRERAQAALEAAGALSPSANGDPGDTLSYPLDQLPPWNQLVHMRAGLAADAERVSIVTGAVPVLALLGTVLGFFFALSRTQGVGLGTSDPLAIVKVMLDAGMDTALATTVAGQGLYLLMSLAYAAFVAGLVETADITLQEGLERARIKETA